MKKQRMYRIRICIWIMISGLFISGVTAFPLETELRWLVANMSDLPAVMRQWLNVIYMAILQTNRQYPYLSYGTDWLAFAHVMLALLFMGVLKDPVKNVWVIEFGMMACVFVIPLALIAGHIRQIPVFWRLLDCSFGVIGIIPMIICYKNINLLRK